MTTIGIDISALNRHKIRNMARAWGLRTDHPPEAPDFMCRSEAMEALLGAACGYRDMVEHARMKHRVRCHGGEPCDGCAGCGFHEAGVYEMATGRSLLHDMFGGGDGGTH